MNEVNEVNWVKWVNEDNENCEMREQESDVFWDELESEKIGFWVRQMESFTNYSDVA